jgi:hypothetical protein
VALADWQNVADVALYKREREVRILTERFYSGGRDGQVSVRDGVSGTKKRLLEPHSVSFEHAEVSGPAQIALTLLADALGDEAHATETHKYFSRRVVALFPERCTISRSRVLAYVNMIEHEKRANPLAGA